MERIQIVLKDALCGCCFKEARAIYPNGLPLCEECFRWLGGYYPIKTKLFGDYRTIDMRYEYLKAVKNGQEVSRYEAIDT